MDEQALVKLYAELTGGTEAVARDVFMMMCERGQQDEPPTNRLAFTGAQEGGTLRGMAREEQFEQSFSVRLV